MGILPIDLYIQKDIKVAREMVKYHLHQEGAPKCVQLGVVLAQVIQVATLQITPEWTRCPIPSEVVRLDQKSHSANRRDRPA